MGHILFGLLIVFVTFLALRSKFPTKKKSIFWGLVLGLSVGYFIVNNNSEKFLSNTYIPIYLEKDSYTREEFKSEEERQLFLTVSSLPVAQIDNNLEGYRKLMNLNKNKEIYSEKYKNYSEKASKRYQASKRASPSSSSSSYSSSSSGMSESQAKSICQRRVQNAGIEYRCETRSCISREVAKEFGSCMRSYGYGRM
tara:strand:+ start:133 stop:723 length:591 start_codon:yes stop_codon:yes gene_type:complete